MSAILGRKVGMISIYDESGRQTVVTVIEAGPCIVTQVKTADGADGYNAVQLGFQDKKAKHTTKALAGHFGATGTTPQRHLVVFRDYGMSVEAGQTLTVSDMFAEGDKIANTQWAVSARSDMNSRSCSAVRSACSFSYITHWGAWGLRRRSIQQGAVPVALPGSMLSSSLRRQNRCGCPLRHGSNVACTKDARYDDEGNERGALSFQ